MSVVVLEYMVRETMSHGRPKEGFGGGLVYWKRHERQKEKFSSRKKCLWCLEPWKQNNGCDDGDVRLGWKKGPGIIMT